ncbi:calcium-binding protein [Calothrix sp. UHCC 0171]|uniref:calcium-binding protein n=1 Tax=Calothrix sp. UHCC 0171 TaxID=3110245 RepID=UPI002B1F256E|nr:calcium-binding protein [Calothrix sp. UHCC 0171]MEA5569743.1 calcium-binding protein [Calothrix sp. UHCC 0171]
MSNVELDANREERIKSEILIDAEDKEDRAMGWYYYLDDSLNFPFNAKWAKKGRKGTSPEKDVEVLGMATEEECLRDMLVEVVETGGSDDDVEIAKLNDLKVLDADSDTQEALNDWYYWVARGYKF